MRKLNEGTNPIKYAGKGVDLSDVNTGSDEIKKGGNRPPVIKSSPNRFQRSEPKSDPIPKTGLGRRDYNVTYSRTGSLIEALVKEGIVDAADVDILRESTPRGKVSPILNEALENNEMNRLIREGIVDANALNESQLQESNDDRIWDMAYDLLNQGMDYEEVLNEVMGEWENFEDQDLIMNIVEEASMTV